MDAKVKAGLSLAAAGVAAAALIGANALTAPQPQEAEVQQAPRHAASSTISGWDEVGLFSDEEARSAFADDIAAWAEDSGRAWPVDVALTSQGAAEVDGAWVFYASYGDGWLECSRARPGAPFAFVPVGSAPGSGPEPTVSDATPDAAAQPAPAQAQPEAPPPAQEQAPAPTPQAAAAPQPRPVSATSAAALAAKLPKDAAQSLPSAMEAWLRSKGISAKAADAKVDMESFSTSSNGVISFQGWAVDSSGAKRALDMEWNPARRQFGFRLV